MRRATTLFLAWLVLAGSSLAGQQPAGAILAPPPPEASCPNAPISCGASVTGSIEETDCKIANGSYADMYALKLPDKRLVTVDLASTDFDSVLIVRNEEAMREVSRYSNAPRQDLVRQDDNSGGGTNAQVEAGAEWAPDTWYLMAQGKKGRSRGAYTLSVKCEDLTCVPDRAAICLNRMRFRVTVHFLDTPDWGFYPSGGDGEQATFGASGPAPGRHRGTAKVSVTDHCAEDGHFRVSAQTEVPRPIRISVTDTRTSLEKVYEIKPSEGFQPFEDRQAFPCR